MGQTEKSVYLEKERGIQRVIEGEKQRGRNTYREKDK
jgi:hypothetical protein